jgi:hypothetical protein
VKEYSFGLTLRLFAWRMKFRTSVSWPATSTASGFALLMRESSTEKSDALVL